MENELTKSLEEGAKSYLEQKLNAPFKRGDKVKIPKGTPVWSLHPQRKGLTPSRTTRTVRIHDYYPGYTYEGEVHPSEIVWAGSGGYWCRAEALLVEKLDE